MESGILVAVPIPRQAQDIGHEVELAIQQALTEAKCVCVCVCYRVVHPCIHIYIAGPKRLKVMA